MFLGKSKAVRGLWRWIRFVVGADRGIEAAPQRGSPRKDSCGSRSGNARVRKGMIQLTWRFLQFQKQSTLAKWFEARTKNARTSRKKMIVALARKLLIGFSPASDDVRDAFASLIAALKLCLLLLREEQFFAQANTAATGDQHPLLGALAMLGLVTSAHRAHGLADIIKLVFSVPSLETPLPTTNPQNIAVLLGALTERVVDGAGRRCGLT
jgi:hypothetical protein